MALPAIPNRHQDSAAHRQRIAETVNGITTFQFDDSRVRTGAEITAGVTPVNYAYAPGDIRRYGGTGDGTTDNTLPLVNWAKSATPGIGMTLESGGVYLFDPSAVTNGVLFSGVANFAIYGNGATIKSVAAATVSAQHEMMRFNNCQDVYAENFTVDANRAARTPVESTSHNINIADNCARMQFKKVRGINAVTDGWYIGTDTGGTASTYPTDITLDSCVGDNAYRNNLSIVAALRPTIRGGRYANATGTSPQGGIDVEPDASVTSGVRDAVFDGVDVSSNVGYGLSFAGPGGSAMNTRMTVLGLTGQANTAGLMAIANVNGLNVDGVHCGPHSAATRGVIDIQSGSVTDVSLRNLNFRGVTISSAARWLLYNIGTNGRLQIAGFRAYGCPSLPAMLLSGITDVSDVLIQDTVDASIEIDGNNCTVRNLVANTATGRVVYITGDNVLCENLLFIDCLVASSSAFAVISGATGVVLRNATVLQTSSIPASAVGFSFAEVPAVVQNVLARCTGTDFTSANAIDFSAGTVGAFITGCTPGGQDFLSDVISPAQITANTNDYAPTGLKGAAILRLNTDASRNVTGLTGGAANRQIKIYNIGGTDLVLTDNDVASAAGNRFLLGANITLNANEGISLWYDGASTKWRCAGRST